GHCTGLGEAGCACGLSSATAAADVKQDQRWPTRSPRPRPRGRGVGGEGRPHGAQWPPLACFIQCHLFSLIPSRQEGGIPMPKVVFAHKKKENEVPAGSNLRDEALKAGVQMNFHAVEIGEGKLGRYLNCRGHGTCGTCAVLVKKGMENL